MNTYNTNTAILVMDVCHPQYSYDYFLEEETNNAFVVYLNARLKDIQKSGAKIIEVNYMGETHPLVNVNFDLSTTKVEDLNNFIIKNQIKELVYTGFHYPICTNASRELGSYHMKNNTYLDRVSIAIQLTRTTKENYYIPIHETTKVGVWQVML